jgi:hypothetical protein
LGQVVELGGPRQVRVSVRIDKDRSVVAVRMLAVAAFDPTTSADLSRRRTFGAHSELLQAGGHAFRTRWTPNAKRLPAARGLAGGRWMNRKET